MVSKSSIIELAKEYIGFYTSVINDSNLPGDIERARYGLKEARHLCDTVEKSEKELDNTQLKTIHIIFSNLVRGVEYFQDDQTEAKHNQLGDKLYHIKEKISTGIKW